MVLKKSLVQITIKGTSLSFHVLSASSASNGLSPVFLKSLDSKIGWSYDTDGQVISLLLRSCDEESPMWSIATKTRTNQRNENKKASSGGGGTG